MLYMLQLFDSFQWCIVIYTYVENLMTSIERIIDYSNLTSEPLYSQKYSSPFLNWPDLAHVSFNNVTLNHDNKTSVLKNATANIKSGEKIGIVGHTNFAFVQSLFRLYEINSGNIFIDGIDIQKISLYDLRSKLSIITVSK
jgi:ABC-type multidrug transport system fused ATPase/permease subunit